MSTTPLPPQAQQLLTTKGFDDLFWEQLKTASTQLEAWQATEEIYKSYFGRQRYANFESYRISRNRRYKK